MLCAEAASAVLGVLLADDAEIDAKVLDIAELVVLDLN